MIITVTGFGVILTDTFGEPKPHLKDIYDALGDKYEDSLFKFDCPSANDPQIVLGFPCALHKHVSLNVLEQQWRDFIEKLPENIKKAWILSGQPEPDFVFLGGKY